MGQLIENVNLNNVRVNDTEVLYYAYKVCNIKMMVLLIKLTLNFHSILYALGFALTEHSKYTSSPSLILSAFNVLPSLRETRGRSAK